MRRDNQHKTYYFLSFSLGSLLLFHGVDKLINGMGLMENIFMAYFPFSNYTAPCKSCFSMGMDFMGGVLLSSSVPYREYIPYVVYTSEVIAPLFLIFGRYVKTASAVVGVYMLIIIYVFHQDELFSITKDGGWSIEVPILYLVMSVALIMGRPHKS